MNAAELHLALNHVPILGTIFGVLLLAYGTGRDSDPVVRAALWALGLAGLAAVGVYFTGEPAEHLVEELAGTSEAALEEHEALALWAAIGGGALGALSLGGLLFRYRSLRVDRGFAAGVLALGVGVAGVLGWTAYQGGQIRHPELRTDFVAPAAEGEREETEAADRDAASIDQRASIALPPAGRARVLAEMRAMLRAVNGVVAAAARDDHADMREAALSGGTRIAVDMGPELTERLPEDFVSLGMSTHRDFDALGAALEAGAGRDSALALLGALTGKCVSCHESYRLEASEQEGGS